MGESSGDCGKLEAAYNPLQEDTGRCPVITYVACDLFKSPARVLVNTVNTVGVMGKGIAKDFKQVYPEMFSQYQQICEKGSFDIGTLWLYKTTNKWVLNFPTKRHWRQPSQPEYVEAGLRKFVETYHVFGITSISFPQLGCGNGELDWDVQVKPLMEQYLRNLPIAVFIHLQGHDNLSIPEHRNMRSIRKWLREEPGSLAFSEVWADLHGLFKDPIELSRLDDGQQFTVTVSEAPDQLTIESRKGVEYIPSEALLELWQQLRQSGFISVNNLPYGLHAYADCIVCVLGELPYVEPVTMAHQYGELSYSPAGGLRLDLQPRQSELPLFAGAGAVEPE